ncbi:oxaloacetate decarboxylase gamma chain [termite gut metagenome]|uniref:Oxaloacetate decarboxylase gamma chain n=1 Tax=termite gut metagenome TaxID=433724 RepID=A0A5J4Q9K0_9ZZZZ
MENIKIALLLIIVGMTTVFAMLLMVINLSKLLIYLVNKYAPEEEVPVEQTVNEEQTSIPKNILAAITATVNVVTSNKGKVVEVKKL